MSGLTHLRTGVEEVDNLGEEEEEEGLGEVPEDRHHRQRHPGEVAEGVAGEHAARVPAEQILFARRNKYCLLDETNPAGLSKQILPVMGQQAEGGAEVGEEEVEGELVPGQVLQHIIPGVGGVHLVARCYSIEHQV